jgi:hypothetical protein
VASPSDIRQGIADSLASLDMQVSPYVLTNPTPPCAYVSRGAIEYDGAMGRSHDNWTFVVTVLVGFVHDIGAQMVLDGYAKSHGPTSIKTLIEADRTLGGTVIKAWVTDTSPERVYQLEGIQHAAVGAEWTVRAMADGRE